MCRRRCAGGPGGGVAEATATQFEENSYSGPGLSGPEPGWKHFETDKYLGFALIPQRLQGREYMRTHTSGRLGQMLCAQLDLLCTCARRFTCSLASFQRNLKSREAR